MIRLDRKYAKVWDFMNGHQANQLFGCDQPPFWEQKGYEARLVTAYEVTGHQWELLKDKMNWFWGWDIAGTDVEMAYRVNGYFKHSTDEVYLLREFRPNIMRGGVAVRNLRA